MSPNREPSCSFLAIIISAPYHQGDVGEFSKGVQSLGWKNFKNYMGVANIGGVEFLILGLVVLKQLLIILDILTGVSKQLSN